MYRKEKKLSWWIKSSLKFSPSQYGLHCVENMNILRQLLLQMFFNFLLYFIVLQVVIDISQCLIVYWVTCQSRFHLPLVWNLNSYMIGRFCKLYDTIGENFIEIWSIWKNTSTVIVIRHWNLLLLKYTLETNLLLWCMYYNVHCSYLSITTRSRLVSKVYANKFS